MFRALLLAALYAAPVLAAPHAKPALTKPAATRTAAVTDWLAVTAATPEGGFRIGNSKARVQLIEYASLTCPHCRLFHETGWATLRNKYIATGKVGYEYRNFILNGPDLAASLLARCDGPAAFFKRVDLLYSTQEQWTAPFAALTPDDATRIAALAPDAQIAGMAKAGGLDSFMAAHGMAPAHIATCLASQPAQEKLSSMVEHIGALGIHQTPTFMVNGVVANGANTWAQVEPLLVAGLR